MNARADTVIEVTVHDGASMDHCLDAAIDYMMDVTLPRSRHLGKPV
ncbi:hypothetical protein [Arthrobacter sp. NPDC057013]